MKPRRSAAPRKWHISEALVSVRRLRVILPELTLEEIENALMLEAGSVNRKNIIEPLLAKAAELNSADYLNSLKEKMYGP